MGKLKSKTGNTNKHLHARISYLQEAASYLTVQRQPTLDSNNQAVSTGGDDEPSATVTTAGKASNGPEGLPSAASNPSARLVSHLISIARKSQIRLSSETKHQICKRCSTLLVEGTTSRKFVENLSKRTAKFPSGKPHADMLVVECGVCGAQKRWPVGATRQRKKSERKASALPGIGGDGGAQVQAKLETDSGKVR